MTGLDAIDLLTGTSDMTANRWRVLGCVDDFGVRLEQSYNRDNDTTR